MQQIMMRLLLKSMFLFSITLLSPIFTTYAAVNGRESISTIDDEYDRYKKKGDDYLKKGDYINAKKQFKNCLEVPGFENDSYANKKIILSDECIALKEQAEVFIQKENGSEGVLRLKQILEKNSEDIETKRKLTDYWKSTGNRYYGLEKFQEAQDNYKEAINYAEDKSTMAILIQNCEDKLNTKKIAQQKQEEDIRIKEAQKRKESQIVVPPKKDIPVVKVKTKVFPKIIVGVIGIGAGAFAYISNSQYAKELSDFNQAAQTYDPDGDGIIFNTTKYSEWQKKYDVLKNSQKNKQIIINACIGISAAAIVVETILLIRKPKVKKGLSFYPNNKNIGLAIRYDF